MPEACSLEATAISFTKSDTLPTSSTIEFKATDVSFAIFVPVPTFLIEFSIITVVSFDAAADFAARLLTSSATTAKPFPYCPALAASTAAFRASIFVWNAISSIVLIIFAILEEESSISSIARSISFMLPLPFSAFSLVNSARLFASLAFSAFCLVCAAISSIDAVNSSIELACSVAPCDKAMLESETCLDPDATC